MISRWARTWSSRVFEPLVRGLARVGATPNQLSLASLLATVLAGVFFALGDLPVGAAIFLLGGLLDSLDGELARRNGLDSPFGAFLDSICDHLGDFALALGLAWHFLSLGGKTEVLLVLAGLFGSVFGSQVRSRAGMLGIELKQTGIFTRMERTLVLSLGVLLGQTTIALWLLAIGNNFSALQRVVAAARERNSFPAPLQRKN